MSLSPVTGQPLAEEPLFQDFIQFFNEPIIGRYAISEFLRQDGLGWGQRLTLDHLKLNEKDTKRLLSMIATHAREAALTGAPPPLIFTETAKSSLADGGHLRDGLFFKWRVWTVEGLWQELQALTLEEKAERTLVNLTRAEQEVGLGVLMRIPFGKDEPPRGNWDDGRINIAGLAYGCTPAESFVAVQYLREEGLIETKLESIYITPKGYVKASRVANGRAEVVPRGFVICRFTDGVDAVYDTVYSNAKLPTGEQVTLLRVKDIHHVEKIDDKIMAEIRAASFVLVDLSDNNFNVGFEAGYALALGKPIVFTMQKPKGELKLPFDIQSHNILVYDESDHTEFKEQLPFRIAAALDKARERGRWSA